MAKQKFQQTKVKLNKPQANTSVKATSSGINWFYIGLLIAFIATFIAFQPSLKNGLTNWDDPTYVEKSDLIKKAPFANLPLYFTEVISSNYHPLTMITLGMDYASAKLEPYRYHLVNFIFHLINSLLVFIFIYKLSKNRWGVALFVAVLFGVHPMHVESVAWISERKDVLYAFFFFLSLIAYQIYKTKQESGKKAIIWIVLCFILFVLAVLSKAMAVILPLVLVLIDYYENRKLNNKWLIIEKIPFLLVSLIFGVVAFKAQVGEAIANIDAFTLFQRIMFGTYGSMMYIYKMLLPLDLSAFYPYPTLQDNGTRLPYVYYVMPVLFLVCAFLVYYTKKFTKDFIFGAGFFFITIVLVLQFMSVGMAIMADRYTYLPYVGLFYIIGNQSFNLVKKNGKFKLFFVFAGALFSIWMISLTRDRIKVWENSETLWTDVISKYPYAEVSYKNRGNYYVDNKMYDKALIDFNNYLNINKSDSKIYSNRGNIFGLKGEFEKSLADYSAALKLDSINNVEAYLNRAITLSMMKKYDLALIDYNKAILIDPKSVSIYSNRAYVYLETNQFDKAISDYTYVLANVEPTDNVYFYRGLAHFKKGDFVNAINDNSKAIELNPKNGGAYFNRSVSYKSIKKYKESLSDALKAKDLGQTVTDVYLNELKNSAF